MEHKHITENDAAAEGLMGGLGFAKQLGAAEGVRVLSTCVNNWPVTHTDVVAGKDWHCWLFSQDAGYSRNAGFTVYQHDGFMRVGMQPGGDLDEFLAWLKDQE